MAGLINVDNDDLEIKQNISGASATKGSKGNVGIAKNVKLDVSDRWKRSRL